LAKRKKPRTPAPPKTRPRPQGDGQAPRPVQAPKVRTGKRRTQADLERRNRLILYALGGSGLLGMAIALLLIFVVGKSSSAGGPAHDNGPNVNFARLVGVRHTQAPWSSGSGPTAYKQFAKRLKPAGLTPLPAQGNALHIHQHLDIFVSGSPVTVPALVGIAHRGHNLISPPGFTELHTHDTTGIIHLESPFLHAYSLGQFFAGWGVYLSKNCIGGYCAKPGSPLKFYVNGKLFLGNPVRLVLQPHQEIAIVYGKPPAHIPSGYAFPAGL
jgi:hypothetical protein